MNPTTSPSLRPLGAFERVIDLYAHRNPVQFSLAAHLSRDLGADELTSALHVLQRAHPLLGAEVERGDAPVFRRSSGGIPLRVAPGSTWEREAAAEQTEPVAPAPGPLVRAVLVPGGDQGAGATVLLTFAHQITDGRGALRVVRDLADVLAGAALPPATEAPRAQEDVAAPDAAPDAAPAPVPQASGGAAAAPVASSARLRPFDGSAPVVQPAVLDAERTRRLRDRARAESCTVQAALCAAAASALFAVDGRERVRINVPVDLRAAVGLPDEVVVRFVATTVVLDRPATGDLWDLARTAAAQLSAARDPDAVRAAVSGLAGLPVTGADDAEAAILAATAADLEITNLGVSSAPGVRAVWGPTMTTQVEGEQILGVVTHGGALRMVNVTHDPLPDLCERIRRTLEAAGR